MDFNSSGRILVTCHRGLAPSLEKELRDLGFEANGSLPSGVWVHGTLKDCISLNLRLRCASQVMFSLKQFNCHNPEQLYRQVRQLPWEEMIEADGYFSVNNFVSHPTVRSTMFPNVKIKDAIVDRMREVKKKRPDSGSELLGAVVYLYWQGAGAELFLDTSGPTLAKHGYRKQPGKAPMMESLAAGILIASQWDREMPFVNPMCGSGTIAIEAAMMRSRRAPGLLREGYAFEHLVGFEPALLQAERAKIRSEIVITEGDMIFASDISSQAIRAAQANATMAGVESLIRFDVCDFMQTPLPETRPMTVMFNPEYGERLGDEDQLRETYSHIGDFFKQRCADSWGYVFTGNMDLGKRVGLRTKRRIEFYAAQLECRLLEFELYSGSRNARNSSSE